jgi:nucleoside-diphosphate-sugar epimerase
VGNGNGKLNRFPLVARGILLAAEARQAIGRTYLLVNDESVTQRDYFNAIARELGVPPPKWYIAY